MNLEEKRELARQALSDRISSFGNDTKALEEFLLDCFFMTEEEANKALYLYAKDKKAELEAIKSEEVSSTTTKIEAVETEIGKIDSALTSLILLNNKAG